MTLDKVQTTEDAVSAHPFLLGMSEHHLRLLADAAMQTHFEQDQVIFREVEQANRFYLIQDGCVVLEAKAKNGEPIVIDTIGSGDLLGWSWLFPPFLWHFSARAVEPCAVIFFYGTVLREYCEQDNSLGFELLKRMSQVMTRRLQLARGKLVAVASSPSCKS